MESEGICRTCLKTTDKLMPLFQTPLLVFKIVAIAPVEVTKKHVCGFISSNTL